ncbi:MAG: YhgE/Pip family protein, partial [Janthinobacterium lividum]
MSPLSVLDRLPLLGRFELHRFKGRLPKLALVFVLLVPLLYGAIYLAANWDPYGKLDRLPVAVVDLDTGTTYDKTALHAGDDFVASLHTQHNFDYRDVSAAEADRGLREGDYYLAITVPADFSADLVSGQGDDPQRAGILLRRNDANGFVIGSITNSAQNAIARSVDESATASYFDAVFVNLAKIRSGLEDATEGASSLHQGISSADDGSATLADGARKAASGADDLHDGARRLATGLSTAQTGSGDLVSGIDRLHAGAGTLADGADQVADGTQQLNDKAQPVLKVAARDLPQIEKQTKDVANSLDDLAQTAAGSTGSISSDLGTIDDALDSLAGDNPGLADDPAFQQARQRVEAASGRADEIAVDVKDGAARVHQANRAVQSAGDLAAQAATASRDLDRLNDGAHDVASGAKTLDRGLGTAESGARKLDAGIG